MYVSMTPGTDTLGYAATIRVGASGVSRSTLMISGGFDPLGIAAQAGDTLWISIQEFTGTTREGYALVPNRRAPAIVRTNPAAGRTDVPLNTIIVVVFSEPMDSASVASGVHLTLRGTEVTGSISPATDSTSGVSFEFHPSAALLPSSTYELGISGGVLTAAGAPLDAATTVDFTTASDSSDPPAELQATLFRVIEFKIADDSYEQVPQLLVLAPSRTSDVHLTGFSLISKPGAAPGDYPWSCVTYKRILPGVPFQVNAKIVTGAYPIESFSETPLAGRGTVSASATYQGADGVPHTLFFSSEIESGTDSDARGTGDMQFRDCTTG